jgi:hypothetical protein
MFLFSKPAKSSSKEVISQAWKEAKLACSLARSGLVGRKEELFLWDLGKERMEQLPAIHLAPRRLPQSCPSVQPQVQARPFLLLLLVLLELPWLQLLMQHFRSDIEKKE